MSFFSRVRIYLKQWLFNNKEQICDCIGREATVFLKPRKWDDYVSPGWKLYSHKHKFQTNVARLSVHAHISIVHLTHTSAPLLENIFGEALRCSFMPLSNSEPAEVKHCHVWLAPTHRNTHTNKLTRTHKQPRTHTLVRRLMKDADAGEIFI